jgi:shikimate kinase
LNIVLIGYRCSGKTVVGKFLAEKLGRTFIDTDEAIEKDMGASIASLITEKGWDHFRNIEKARVLDLSGKDNLVIATGGGVVLDRDNIRTLKENGWIVWLHGQPEVLKARMARDAENGRFRPSLSGADPQEEVDRMLEERSGLYEQAADFVVTTDHQLPDAVAGTIMKALEASTTN